MAKIGQIVYNLEDYSNSGGLVSTSVTGSLIYSSNGESAYESSKVNIYAPSNLVPSGTRFMKIGIQAPPGTKVVLNTDKIILIGQSGIYELDEDIAITSMYFIQPQIYYLNETASNQKVEDGKSIMREAEKNRQDVMEDLSIMPLTEEDEQWQDYINAQNTFNEEYYKGLALYREGKAGVYELDPNKKGDLYNIIIDYLQEGG